MSFSCSPLHPPHIHLENDCHTSFWHTTGSILNPLVMHLSPLLGVFWKGENHFSPIFMTPEFTQAKHRALIPHTDDKGNQKTRDFQKWSVSPATQRKPRDLATQESPVTSPGSLVECQGQKPDGNFCQLLWIFHITEMVPGDNILKAHKMQKYL